MHGFDVPLKLVDLWFMQTVQSIICIYCILL